MLHIDAPYECVCLSQHINRSEKQHFSFILYIWSKRGWMRKSGTKAVCVACIHTCPVGNINGLLHMESNGISIATTRNAFQTTEHVATEDMETCRVGRYLPYSHLRLALLFNFLQVSTWIKLNSWKFMKWYSWPFGSYYPLQLDRSNLTLESDNTHICLSTYQLQGL